MITTAEQYNAHLHLIYNNNPPTYAALPDADNIYNIDIRTREIDAPRFLSVEKDHESETIYFIIDRYAGYMDLSKVNCVIYYTNANKKSYAYAVPFYDIYTYSHVNKMIIPWCLDRTVTEGQGTVEFFIQFFLIKEGEDESENVFSYILNTLPAKSQILKGMTVQPFEEEYKLNATQYDILLNEINTIKGYFYENGDKDKMIITHWTILD